MKKILALVLAVAMMLVALVGCTATTTTTTAAPAAAAPAAAPAAAATEAAPAAAATEAAPAVESNYEIIDGVKQIPITLQYDSTVQTNTYRMEVLIEAFKLLEQQDPTVHFIITDFTEKTEFSDLVLQAASNTLQCDLFLDYENIIPSAIEANLILPIDEVWADGAVEAVVSDGMKEGLSYGGHTYGIPIDMSIEVVTLNKDMLKALGYTDEDIAALPEKVRNNEYTWDDLEADAHKAVDQGIAEIGYFMDGNDQGSQFTNMRSLGINPDNGDGTLTYDAEQWMPFFEFWYNSFGSITPRDLSSYEGRYEAVMDGKVFAWHDCSSYEHWKNNTGKDMSAQEFSDWYQEHFIDILPPSKAGVTPVTMCKIRSFFVTNRVDDEKLGYIIQAMKLAYSDDNLKMHEAIFEHGKPACVKAAYNCDMCQNVIAYFGKIAYMLDGYLAVRPINADWVGGYMKQVRNAVDGIALGDLDAAGAAAQAKADIEFNVPSVIVK